MEDKIKILIVDDDVDTRMMICNYFSDGEYDFITAKNGKEALEKAALNLPKLIIMDFMMPNLNGIETANILRKNPKTSLIPVILITGFKHEYIDNELKKWKNIVFLTKPIKFNELEIKIKELILKNS